MGSFRLGGHRRNRGQSPPVSPAASGTGVPNYAERAERDYGSMANPLANGAHRSRTVLGEHQSYAQIQRTDNGRPRDWQARGTTTSRPAMDPPLTGLGRPGLQEGHRDSGAGVFGAPAKVDEAESQRFNQELLKAPEPAEKFTDYRALRKAVDEATHPSYAPDHPAPRRAASHTPLQEAWSSLASEPDFQEEEEDDEVAGPRILVLDRNGDFSNELAQATVDLEPIPEILRLGRSTQVIEVVDQEEPDILVLAPEEMTGAGLKRVTSVHRSHPEIVMVLSGSDKDFSPSQIAATGAEDLLPQNPDQEQLRDRIAEAVETVRRRRSEVIEVREEEEAGGETFQFTSYDEPEPASYTPSFMQAPRREAKASTNLARVFTVASASGGCGKTFYSTNLAAYLARATGGKVLLIDLDLQFGEVAISLHLRPQRTIAELISEDDIRAAFGDYVLSHAGEFHVLCAPRDPIAGERVGPREATAVLEAARAAYDYIVVDTPPSINETVLAAFDQSQSLVLMATMDLPSLKNLRVFMETLRKLNLPADQISVIVNKAESGTGINLKEIEPLYPQGFSAVLPYAKQVSWSINMGMPVLMADPDADISRKFVEGAVRLVKPVPGVTLPWSTSTHTPTRGWFSRLLKGNG